VTDFAAGLIHLIATWFARLPWPWLRAMADGFARL